MAELETINSETYATVERQLRVISSIIKETGRQMLKEFNISPPQFVALQWISEEDGITIGELSSRTYLAFSTTTDLVDRMEEREFVKRVKDENDKRVVRISLLPKGRESIRAVIRKRQEYLAEKMSILSEEDKACFQFSLDQIYQELKKDF